MTDTTSAFPAFTPERTSLMNGRKGRRRSISTSLHESTPAIKSLCSIEHIDHSSNDGLPAPVRNVDLLTPYDKLTTWKRTMEKHLNRIYLLKLKEVDQLLADVHKHVDITFGTIPSFDQLVMVYSRAPMIDHTYDTIEFDLAQSQGFDLSSNNILLCTSNQCALIYDDKKAQLILYNDAGYLSAFAWDTSEYGDPCDLTYSDYLDLYCIITNRGLFTWSDENPSTPLHIDSIKPIAGNRLWTMASTDNHADVFILFKLGSYVERWSSIVGTKSWQSVQRWSNHDLFERNDQRIRTIRMTSNHVAWTVESTKTSEWRVDLLDYHLQVIRRGVKIDHLDRSSSCLLSNFGPEHFLVTDSNCHLLFLLNSDGRLQMKVDPLITKRIKNSALLKTNDRQWLVVRLEQPDQLYFIALCKQTGTTNVHS